ncbi:MAG: HAMP domain-containing histidine kinase [Nocardioides sp.]|nr:HAMP domain-containing histidine kinase [Nocardioides sp.]
MNGDQFEILVVALMAAVAIGALGLVVGWLLRTASVRWQLGLVAAVSVLSVLAGVLAVAQRMLLMPHDLKVVTIVTIAAAASSFLVAFALGAALVRWSRGLQEEVRRVGTGVAARPSTGPREFQELSAELATTVARLDESRARETRLESSRRELVSWVSHDLRTPLAGMRAMTEALEDGMAPDPARYHRQIRAEVDRMVRMVDDLFELSRLHAGVFTITPQEVALGDLVSEALAGADPVARARGVRLGGNVDHGLQVLADPEGLSRVLANLLMNGIRHTPANGVVQVTGRAVAGGVELSVTDGCGGILEEDLTRVFDVAWRGAAARTPEPDPADAHTARAGLGLAIVKGIVEAHRGVVEVVNEPGVPGCRFLVRLPA